MSQGWQPSPHLTRNQNLWDRIVLEYLNRLSSDIRLDMLLGMLEVREMCTPMPGRKEELPVRGSHDLPQQLL